MHGNALRVECRCPTWSWLQPPTSPAPNPLPSCHCQLLHKAATKIYSADGKLLKTVNGITGVPREVIDMILKECPVHADRRPRLKAARPKPVGIKVDRAFWQCQVCSKGAVCAMRAAAGCVHHMHCCAVFGGSLTYLTPGTAAAHSGGLPAFLHLSCCSWT